MGTYKVYVYAICKNEAAFVPGWMASMGEADGIYVLDTGSEDGSVEALRGLGAKVTAEKITPWRFDTARNRSLALVPEDGDICVCTDLDEAFHPGWRQALEQAWEGTAGRARYRYTWSFTPEGREGVVFWLDQVHSRRGWQWKGPVHEVLVWQGPGPEPKTVEAAMQLDHYPDPGKSRGQYLPLLELAVAEDPENDRNLHYLGREYMFYGRWLDSIAALKRHLSLPKALWADERCASMRFLARNYEALGQHQEAEGWLKRAIAEAPWLREPWIDYAMFAYAQGDWEGVVWLTERALQIRERPQTYITEPESWGSRPHDLASLGYFYTDRPEKALEQVNKALEYEPENPRLLENRELIEKACRAGSQ